MPDGVTDGFDRVKFPGWFSDKGRPFDAYYDDIYVAVGDNAFARVELSDAESHASSVKNVVMPVISWSGNNIEVKIHEEHFQDSGEVFLRVYDAQNNSVAMSFAPGTAVSPPAPPSNFEVNF